MKKDEILQKLKELKPLYFKDGLIIKGLFGSYARDEASLDSDIDILVEATPEFAEKYGFNAVGRLHEIKCELESIFAVKVDLADASGMGKNGKKFIIDRTIYV